MKVFIVLFTSCEQREWEFTVPSSCICHQTYQNNSIHEAGTFLLIKISISKKVGKEEGNTPR
jgi:hypothetical protein